MATCSTFRHGEEAFIDLQIGLDLVEDMNLREQTLFYFNRMRQ